MPLTKRNKANAISTSQRPIYAPLPHRPGTAERRGFASTIAGRARYAALRFGPAFRWSSRRDLASIARGAAHFGVDAGAAVARLGGPLIVDVDPRRVALELPSAVLLDGEPHLFGRELIDAADWSACLAPVSATRHYREMRKLVLHGANFRELRFYRRMADSIAAGRHIRRNRLEIGSAAALANYFDRYLALIADIRDHGYRRADRSAPPGREAALAIGPDGALIRCLGGHHRFAIAATLGLASIPIEIRLIHFGWLDRRAVQEGCDHFEILVRLFAEPELATRG